MNKLRRLMTSESVSEGHPDKVADRISDEILDAHLRKDPNARVAVETLVTAQYCLIAGEVSGRTVDYAAIARRAITDIGYSGGEFGSEVEVDVRVHRQSPEIRSAVSEGGAGDQGVIFGYACRETPALMPAPIYYAHRIAERLARVRRKRGSGLLPDAKVQVTVEYNGARPVRAHTIIVSHQHEPRMTKADLVSLVVPHLVAVLPLGWLDDCTRVLVNEAGSFVVGGPVADTGLTGRKVIVDTYGGAVPHGGGAFSGKDPTKVDRSGAYMARYLAKNVVAAGLAEECLIQVAYAIGLLQPVALEVDCRGTGMVDEQVIARVLLGLDLLTQAKIRRHLVLDRPIYAPTAAYGHFGREAQENGCFSWERTDLATTLSKAVTGANRRSKRPARIRNVTG